MIERAADIKGGEQNSLEKVTKQSETNYEAPT